MNQWGHKRGTSSPWDLKLDGKDNNTTTWPSQHATIGKCRLLLIWFFLIPFICYTTHFMIADMDSHIRIIPTWHTISSLFLIHAYRRVCSFRLWNAKAYSLCFFQAFFDFLNPLHCWGHWCIFMCHINIDVIFFPSISMLLVPTRRL